MTTNKEVPAINDALVLGEFDALLELLLGHAKLSPRRLSSDAQRRPFEVAATLRTTGVHHTTRSSFPIPIAGLTSTCTSTSRPAFAA